MTTAIATRDARVPAPRAPSGLESMSFEPTNLEEALHLFTLMVPTGLLPKHLATPQHALVCYLVGRALNLPMMTILMNMFVVNGVPRMKTELLVALARASAVCDMLEVRESTPERCTVVAQRKGSEPQSFTWTMEMAKRANLLGREPWRLYPQRMLMWRAYGDAVAALFSDVTNGITAWDDDEDPVRASVAPGIRNAPALDAGGAGAHVPARSTERLKATAQRFLEAPPVEASAVLEEARTIDVSAEPAPQTADLAPVPPQPEDDRPTSAAPASSETPEQAEKKDLEDRAFRLWNEVVAAAEGDTEFAREVWDQEMPKKQGTRTVEQMRKYVANGEKLKRKVAALVEARARGMDAAKAEPGSDG